MQTPEGSQTSTPYLPQFDKSVLQFLILEKNRIKAQFRKIFGTGVKVMTSTGKLELVLELSNANDIGAVTKCALENLQVITKQLLAFDIVIQGDDFMPLICSNVLPKIDKKRVDVYTEQDKLIVVGFRPEVDNIYREVKQILGSQSQKYLQTKLPFGHCTPECVCQLKIMTVLQTLYPSVEIELQQDGLLFKGEEIGVENCIIEYGKCERNIQFSEEKFAKCYIELLQKPETKAYIYDVFHEKQLNSCYEVDASLDTVMSFAMSKPKAEDALQCIRNNFSKIFYSLDKPLDSLVLSCNKWEEIVSNHKNKKLLEQEEKEQLVLFGTKDVTKELHELAVNMAKSELQLPSQTVQQVSVYKYNPPPLIKQTIEIPVSVEYLLNTNVQWKEQVSAMVGQISGAKIRTKENKTILYIEGIEADVNEAVKRAKRLLVDLQVKKTESVSEDYHSFFNRKEVQMYLIDVFREKGLSVFITTTSDVSSYKIQVIGIDDKSVSKAWKTIKATIKKGCYSVGITKTLQEKLSLVEKDFQGKALLVGNDVGCDTLDVFSTSDVHDPFFKKIMEVIESDNATEQYCETTLNARKEKVEFITPWLQQIAEKYEVPVKSIQHRPDLSTVMITGTKESSKQISEELVQKFSSVNISCVLLEGNDTDYFQRTNEDKTIARKNNCNLQITGRQTKAARCYVEQDNHVLVEIVCARTTDMEVDVIVCPTNDCLFSIGDMDEVLKGTYITHLF